MQRRLGAAGGSQRLTAPAQMSLWVICALQRTLVPGQAGSNKAPSIPRYEVIHFLMSALISAGITACPAVNKISSCMCAHTQKPHSSLCLVMCCVMPVVLLPSGTATHFAPARRNGFNAVIIPPRQLSGALSTSPACFLLAGAHTAILMLCPEVTP